eukprot:11506871-Ditylum_brightwellii.AAC.1
MSDDGGDESLDKFESMNEELSVENNVELTVNPVGDAACHNNDETEVSGYAYFSTIGGDLAKDHEVKKKSGSYINSYVLINSGGMALIRKKNELSGAQRERGFLQKIVALNGEPVPLLYPEG